MGSNSDDEDEDLAAEVMRRNCEAQQKATTSCTRQLPLRDPPRGGSSTVCRRFPPSDLGCRATGRVGYLGAQLSTAINRSQSTLSSFRSFPQRKPENDNLSVTFGSVQSIAEKKK